MSKSSSNSPVNPSSNKVLIMLLILVAILALYYFLNKQTNRQIDDSAQKNSPKAETQEEITAKQMEELDKLRKETPHILTKAQINAQEKELEKLRKKTPPLTQEQIVKQTEELNKLRSQNNK